MSNFRHVAFDVVSKHCSVILFYFTFFCAFDSFAEFFSSKWEVSCVMWLEVVMWACDKKSKGRLRQRDQKSLQNQTQGTQQYQESLVNGSGRTPEELRTLPGQMFNNSHHKENWHPGKKDQRGHQDTVPQPHSQSRQPLNTTSRLFGHSVTWLTPCDIN